MTELAKNGLDSVVLPIDWTADRLSEFISVLREFGFRWLELNYLTDHDCYIINRSIPMAIVSDPPDPQATTADLTEFRRNHPETKIVYLADEIGPDLETRIRETGVLLVGCFDYFIHNSEQIFGKVCQWRTWW